MNKSLAIVSALPEDQEFVKKLGETLGDSVLVAATPAEACQFIAADKTSDLFVDLSTESQYRQLETQIQDTLGLFSDSVSRTRFHFMTSVDLSRVSFLLEGSLFGSLISRNFGDVVQAAKSYAGTVTAVRKNKGFGLDQVLGASAKIQTVKVNHTQLKQEAVEAVRNFLIGAKFKPRMSAVIANAVDELLMNAMFDAPIDMTGRPIYEKTSRAAKMALEGKGLIEMKVGIADGVVGVSVHDQYGSLDRIKLVSAISHRYKEEEFKIKGTVAGAGIGLASVYRAGGSLFFVSEASARTEVTVFFRKFDTFRDFKDQFKFIATHFLL